MQHSIFFHNGRYYAIRRGCGGEHLMSEKLTVHNSLPKYRCPKCGSYNIECQGYCTLLLNKEGNVYYVSCLEPGYVDDCKRCMCMSCGNIGYLYRWKEKNNG